jgi:hypothetical protein
VSTTLGDLLQSSLEKIGVYGVGQPINAADAARGLSVFNRMMDNWSTQNLACFANAVQSAVLTPGKYQYTIGLSGGADIALTRPLEILDGYGSAFVTDVNGFRYEVNVVQQDKWNQIATVGSVNAQIPDTLFYDPQFPLGVINLYGTPLLGYTLSWMSRLKLAEAANLSTTISLPEGYEAAIENNLALWIAPYFKSANVSDDLKAHAMSTFADVKRKNIRPIVAEFDSEIVSRGTPTYNIYNDSNS